MNPYRHTGKLFTVAKSHLWSRRVCFRLFKTLVLVSLFAIVLACSRHDGGGSEPDPDPKPAVLVDDDSYTTIGNTPLEVGVSPVGTIAIAVNASVLDNDSSTTGHQLDVTTVTPGSGSVTMNPDGTFYYVPAPGVVGSDSFTYDVSDGTNSASAVVTITINNRIWYVDNSASGTLGTASSPFSTLLDAQLAAQAGDTIYITGDNTGAGMDQGLSLNESDIRVIGSGVPLVVDSISLAPAGIVPVISNSFDNVLSIDNAANTYIAGVRIEGGERDGVHVFNSTGVVLEDMSILNSGESAIEGDGGEIGLDLINVEISQVDQTDSTTSDDAVFLHPTAGVTFNMQGGSIDGVPGRLGDGIVLLNTDRFTTVDMQLTVQGASLTNIGQDGIKVDNENGLVNIIIGGAQPSDGNELIDVGYRGIVIMTDGDQGSLRTNSIVVQNNMIRSNHEEIQFRGIDDRTQLAVNNNILPSSASEVTRSKIDLQFDDGAQSQARVNDNSINGVISNADFSVTGLRVRLFDGAGLSMEARRNTLDTLDAGLLFTVRDLTGVNITRLDTTVTDNVLQNIVPPHPAMRTVNYHDTSATCLDLRNNTPELLDYMIEVNAGEFYLALNSQPVNVTIGWITDQPVGCQLPTF